MRESSGAPANADDEYKEPKKPKDFFDLISLAGIFLFVLTIALALYFHFK